MGGVLRVVVIGFGSGCYWEVFADFRGLVRIFADLWRGFGFGDYCCGEFGFCFCYSFGSGFAVFVYFSARSLHPKSRYGAKRKHLVSPRGGMLWVS